MRNATEKVSLFILQNLPSVILFFIPLFFLTNTIDYFAFNKFYLLNLFASISLIFWCIYNISTNKISLTLSSSQSSLFLIVIAHLASAFFMSPTKVLSLTGTTTLFVSLFIIHLTTTSVHQTKNQINNQVVSLLASVTILSLFSIAQVFGLNSYIFGEQVTKSRYFNLTGGIVPALTLSLPILTGLLVYLYSEKNLKIKTAIFIIFGFISIASIINISYLLPKNNVSPVNQLPLSASWSISLDIFKYPGTALIGTGPENYLATFTRLRPIFLNNSNNWNTRFSESGSFFLTLVTTTGLMGGIGLLSLFVNSITQSLRTANDSKDKSLQLFLTTAIAGYLVSLLLTPSGISTLIICISLFGTLVQIQKNSENKYVKSLHFNISTDGHQIKTLTNFLPIFLTIISLTVISLYWKFGFSFYKASMLLKEANANLGTDITSSFLKQQKAQSLNPYDATYSIIISQTYQQVALYYLQKQNPTEQDKKNSIEMMQRSIDAGRQAAKTDPFNVLVWENLSGVYQSFIGSAAGAEDLALSHLTQAISLDPTNPKLRLQLGILYFNLKDKDQSLKLINQAIELKPSWEIPYLNLYRIYLESKDFQKAEVNLKQALALTSQTSPDYEKIQQELISLTEKLNKE